MADLEYHGPLPLPVEVWMDEFANGARPDRFENLITTLRSRNISATIFLQSVDQIKTIYKGDTWGILMDACSTFMFLGAGRGSLATQEYISKLLGQATIDKRTEGEHRGHNGNSNLNFDRAAKDLMAPAEIGRLPKEKCIILLEGHQPIIDNKIRPFKSKTFLHAQSLGCYHSPVVVRKTASGGYETIKAPGMMQPLDDDSVAYYRGLAAEGKAQIFEIDEESFLSMDFGKDEPEIDFGEVARIIENSKIHQEEKATHADEGPAPAGPPDIFEMLKETELSDEQFEEIIGGLEDGLTEEQVMQYFYMEPDKMRQMRRYYRQKNKMEGSGNG